MGKIMDIIYRAAGSIQVIVLLAACIALFFVPTVLQLFAPELSAICLGLLIQLGMTLGLTGRGAAGQSSAETRSGRELATICRFSGVALILGLYLLIRLGWRAEGPQGGLVAMFSLWAAGCLAGGGALGFLFGLPRVIVNEQVRPGDDEVRYRANTNLEKVSDWLTQIIVGGTVVQLALLPGYLGRLGAFFADKVSALAGGALPQSQWVLVGVASFLYFSILGFLSVYLISRMYLSGAIKRAEHPGERKAATLSKITRSELTVLEEAPIVYGEDAEAPDTHTGETAAKIRELPLDQLDNWRDIRVWAKAQLFQGGSPELALKAYNLALDLVPNDAETNLGCAVAMQRTKGSPASRLTKLERARDSIMASTALDLRKNIHKGLAYAYLYLRQPDGFMKSLATARAYYAHPDARSSSGLDLNIACAYAQASVWFKDNPPAAATMAALVVEARQTDIPTRAEEIPAWAAAQALAFARRCVARNGGFRAKISGLLQGRDGDDDFVPFQDNPEWKALAAEVAPSPAPASS